MGQGAIDYIGVKGGLDINGIIQDYYVYAGENISAGDFVEFIRGIANREFITTESVLISSSGSRAKMYPFLLSTGNICIVYGGTSTNRLYGIVCSIVDNKIIVGTQTTLNSDADCSYAVSATYLTGDFIFVTYGVQNTSSSSPTSTRYLGGLIASVSGTTITVKTKQTIKAISYYGLSAKCVSVSDDRVLILHSVTNDYSLGATVVKYSGGTLSVGTTNKGVSYDGGDGYGGGYMYLEAIAQNKALAGLNNDRQLCGQIITTSDLTVSVGTAITMSSHGYSAVEADIIPLSATKILVLHTYQISSNVYGLACSIVTVSGSTLTRVIDTFVLSRIENAGEYMSGQLLADGRVAVFHTHSAEDYLYGMIVTVNSDNTIQVGIDNQISAESDSGYLLKSMSLSENVFFVLHTYSNSTNIGAWVLGLDESTDTLSSTHSITEYETQIKKTTKVSFNGIAETNGIGGTETEHNQQVRIYVPDI